MSERENDQMERQHAALWRELWPTIQSLAALALMDGTPAARRHVTAIVHRLEKAKTRPLPADIRRMAAQGSRELARHLERTRARSSDHGPTPETAAHVEEFKKTAKPDVIERLKERGAIDANQQDAAEEIRAIVYAVVRSLQAKGGAYDGMRMESKKLYTQPIERLPDWLQGAYSDYQHWARKLQTRNAIGLRLTLDVLCGGSSMRQAERKWSLRNGKGTEMLLSCLKVYAEERGWG